MCFRVCSHKGKKSLGGCSQFLSLESYPGPRQCIVDMLFTSAVILRSVELMTLYFQAFLTERNPVLFLSAAAARCAVFFSRHVFKSSNRELKLFTSRVKVRLSRHETPCFFFYHSLDVLTSIIKAVDENSSLCSTKRAIRQSFMCSIPHIKVNFSILYEPILVG